MFKHALVQESAYHSTLIQQRKVLHLTVAQATEKIFKERLKEFYGILAYHYGKANKFDKAEEYVIKAGEEALRSSASSEALNYYQEGLKLYLDNCGADADLKKIVSLEKSIAIAFYNKGEYENAVRYFDKIMERWGEGASQNKLVVATKLLFNLLIIIISLYLPLGKAKKDPENSDNEAFDLRYKRVESLVYIDNKRLFIEVVAMVRKGNKFDMAKVVNGPQQWLIISAIFSFIGVLFRVRTKFLERAKDIIDKNNIKHQITYIAVETTHHHCAGTWSKIGDYNADQVNLALKNGEIWHASTYIWWLAGVKTQQGKFMEVELLLEKLLEISEVYDHSVVRAYYRWQKMLFLIKKRNIHDALIESEAGVRWTAEKRFEEPLIHIHFFGLKVISQILAKDVNGAEESILQIKKLVSKQESIAATFQATYKMGEFLTDIYLLEQEVHSKNTSSVSIQRKKTYKSGIAAVKNAGKYALFRTECYGMMGLYYWLLCKQKKALKWWEKAITEGKRLDSRVDLARTFMEVGKHLLEPNAKIKEFNGINGRGYLEKAGILFEEMGLQQDLYELEKLN
jgi:tetratricopeptide (TPR) repeat protein